MSRIAERVTFPGANGHALHGRLHRPVGPVLGTAVFAHCFTCSKDIRAARGITEALAAQGFATLRFDFTGLGESEGDFSSTGFGSNIADLLEAANCLGTHVAPPTLLVGHSLGGAAVYEAAARLDSVMAVASIGAPSDPEHVTHLFGADLETIQAKGEATVDLGGRPFRITRAFVEDLSSQHLLTTIGTLRRAVLVLHSPTDNTVGVRHARALFEAARHPKSFVSLDGADHLLTHPADATYAGTVIAAWARRYAVSAEPERRPAHQDDVEVVTAEGFATDITIRALHRLRADEPVAVGGTDGGPTPYELVSAGLGSCTSITLRMYADRKEMALAEIEVHVRHAKEEVDGKKVDVWERRIRLTGDLSDEERKRLMSVADRCPVHRTLEAVAHIRTLADR